MSWPLSHFPKYILGKAYVPKIKIHPYHRGGTASDPTAPAQIPACGFPAPGSSGILAAAVQPRHARRPIAEADARRGEDAPPGSGATGPDTRSTYSFVA